MSFEQGSVAPNAAAPAAATQPAATPPVNQPLINPAHIQPFQTVTTPAPAGGDGAPVTYTRDQLVSAVAESLGTTPEELSQRLGQNDPLKSVGALARDALGVIRENRARASNPTPVATAPVAQTVQAPITAFDPNKEIKLPDGIEGSIIRQEGDTWVPINDSYKQYADAKNHNVMVQRRQAQQLMSNPLGLLDTPEFQARLDEMVEKRATEKFQKQQAEQVRENYRQKFSPEIFVGGKYNEGFDGKPNLTPVGVAYLNHLDTLSRAGMGESPDLYEKAMMLARYETGSPSPGRAAAPGTPAQPHQPPSTVSQFLTQAQTYTPGSPPSRPATPATNLRGSLFQIANDVGATEDMTVEQIMARAGSLLTAGSGRR